MPPIIHRVLSSLTLVATTYHVSYLTHHACTLNKDLQGTV